MIRELCVLSILSAAAVDAVQDTGKAVFAGDSPLLVSSVAGPSARDVIGGVSCDATPQTRVGGLEGKTVLTLPRFDSLSVESSASYKLDARLKWRLACLKIEREKRRKQFQLKGEFELKRLGLESESYPTFDTS